MYAPHSSFPTFLASCRAVLATRIQPRISLYTRVHYMHACALNVLHLARLELQARTQIRTLASTLPSSPATISDPVSHQTFSHHPPILARKRNMDKLTEKEDTRG